MLAAIVAVTGLVRSATAWADDVPADPAAHGYIGLCGIDGKPMTGGSIHDKPFVWEAIASQPPPKEAQGTGLVATLYAFQPRPGVLPGDWNGDQLTATSPYSTPDAPATQATKLDNGLDYVVKDYPPMVNGLYELRMLFGNTQNSGYTDQYAATFIRVEGDHWSVVKGGTVDCDKGKAVSTEIEALGSASAAGTPTASAPFGGPAGTGVPKDTKGVPLPSAASGNGQTGPGVDGSPSAPKTSGKAGPTSSTARSTTAGATSNGSDAPPGGAVGGSDPAVPVAATSSDGGSAAGVVVLVVVLAVLAAGGGWFGYRRLRSPASGRT